MELTYHSHEQEREKHHQQKTEVGMRPGHRAKPWVCVYTCVSASLTLLPVTFTSPWLSHNRNPELNTSPCPSLSHRLGFTKYRFTTCITTSFLTYCLVYGSITIYFLFLGVRILLDHLFRPCHSSAQSPISSNKQALQALPRMCP